MECHVVCPLKGVFRGYIKREVLSTPSFCPKTELVFSSFLNFFLLRNRVILRIRLESRDNPFLHPGTMNFIDPFTPFIQE